MTATFGRAIVVWWHEMDRWVVPSAALLSRRLPTGWVRTRIGDAVKLVSNVVKVAPMLLLAQCRHSSEETVTVANDLCDRQVGRVMPNSIVASHKSSAAASCQSN